MQVMLKIAYKECRVDALDIKQTSKTEMTKQVEKVEQSRKVSDPLLFSLIASPRFNKNRKEPQQYNLTKENILRLAK